MIFKTRQHFNSFGLHSNMESLKINAVSLFVEVSLSTRERFAAEWQSPPSVTAMIQKPVYRIFAGKRLVFLALHQAKPVFLV
ncbi:hypothetical protein PV433_10940 [Paenibacillus sp. GYB004]